MRSVLIARVSTEEQGDAGNSLPAQLVRMNQYCEKKGCAVEKEFEVEESAYKAKRDEFDKAIDFITNLVKKEKIIVCFDKVDRLSRNVFDKRVGLLYEWALEDKIELHFVSDNQILSSRMSAVEKFHFGINLGLAKYYSDAISDNTKRGFEQKRRKGEWTGSAPFGYRSVMLDVKKRLRADLVPDPINTSYIREIFEMYASGNHSINTICKYLNDKKVLTERGKRFCNSTVHAKLKNTFYYGKAYSRKYKIYYDHRYEPLIEKALFDRVQELLDKRNQNPSHRQNKRVSPFMGLLKCKVCGCSICREVKRGKPYWACSNAKKMHKREYVQEGVLLEAVQPIFESLALSDKQIEQITDYLRENHEYKAKYYREQTSILHERFERLQVQKDKLLDLLLDERITQPEYDKKLEKLNDEQQIINIDREGLTDADYKYHITAKQVLNLAKRAGELFEQSNDEEKNELMKLVLSNAVIDGKKLEFSIRKPFDTIANVKGYPILLRR